MAKRGAVADECILIPSRGVITTNVSVLSRRPCWQERAIPAEVAVLRLIADGNGNKQIADQLRVTEDTVKGRVKSILAKLDANDRTHAAIIGLKRGIIDLSGV
jgi:DNA-binding NarL/FixJ family response regulator